MNEDHLTRDMNVAEGFEGEKNFNKGRCWYEGAFWVEDTVKWKRKWTFRSTQVNGFVPPGLERGENWQCSTPAMKTGIKTIRIRQSGGIWKTTLLRGQVDR